MKTRFAAITAIFLFVLYSNHVSANNMNAGGHKGVARTLSAQTIGETRVNIGATLKYDGDHAFVAGPGGAGEVIQTATGNTVEWNTPQLFSGNLFAAYGLRKEWDIGIALPLYHDKTGWGIDRSGIGDLNLTTKIAYPFQTHKALVSHAYYLKVTLPTGSKDQGYFPRHVYHIEGGDPDGGNSPFTAGGVLFNPMLLWTMHFDRLKSKLPLQLHINFGGVVTKVKSSSAVVASIGLEYIPSDMITLFTEISGEARVKYYTESFSTTYFENDPFWLSPGIKVNLPKGICAVLAGDFGMSSQEAPFRTAWNRGGYRYSTSPLPAYGVQFTLGWSGFVSEPDVDRDGVVNKLDKCPHDPEDRDKFKDEDGCPDPDNDNDGILDVKDKCPNKTATCDGCPVYDADGDGVLDNEDKCPKDPEDKDGFEDADGCPDLDNDKDGVPDKKDSCPGDAEDVDGFEDSNGCPDVDNDADGILDNLDKCPNEKGVAEKDGCPKPKTKEIQRGKLILNGVTFRSGKADLSPNSYTILDQVYESLAEWKEVKVEIQGHTDSRGGRVINKKLSQSRAESVMQYLVRKGIDPSRLRAVGYGEEDPIASNRTAQGRNKNRRVQLHRFD